MILIIMAEVNAMKKTATSKRLTPLLHLVLLSLALVFTPFSAYATHPAGGTCTHTHHSPIHSVCEVPPGPNEPCTIQGKKGICHQTAASCMCQVRKDSAAASPPPSKHVQVTFTAIEPKDTVTVSPKYARGKAIVTFIAKDDQTPTAGPPVNVTETEEGATKIEFTAGLPPDTTTVVTDETGGKVTIDTTGTTTPPPPHKGLTPAFAERLVITNGSGHTTLSGPLGQRIEDVRTPEGGKDTTVDVVASKEGTSGTETGVALSGVPSDACKDGQLTLDFKTDDGKILSQQVPVACINYFLKQVFQVGETAPLTAKVAGLKDNQLVNFTFEPDPARHTLSPLENKLKAAQINAGAPLTQVTALQPGRHAFGIVTEIAPLSEEGSR
jgi:hypothetical protein